MIEFEIPALSCGHCVQAVTQAVKAADPAAQVQVDLARKRVQVQSSAAPEVLAAQLAEAGYPPA